MVALFYTCMREDIVQCTACEFQNDLHLQTVGALSSRLFIGILYDRFLPDPALEISEFRLTRPHPSTCELGHCVLWLVKLAGLLAVGYQKCLKLLHHCHSGLVCMPTASVQALLNHRPCFHCLNSNLQYSCHLGKRCRSQISKQMVRSSILRCQSSVRLRGWE